MCTYQFYYFSLKSAISLLCKLEISGKRTSLPVLEIRDPQIRDLNPCIFTGIKIRDPGSAIRAKNSADLQHCF